MEIKELFELNESLLVFDVREVENVDEEYLKEILIFNIRNIKKFNETHQPDKDSIKSFKDLNMLSKVYNQILNLNANHNEKVKSEVKNKNEITNLSLESISFNDFSKNNSMFHSDVKTKAQSKKKKSAKKSKATEDVTDLKRKCEQLEHRCLSLALENKLLRSKTKNEEKVRIDSLNQDLKNRVNISLNNSNWQPTMNDISEIALISGLSIDRARQAFTTIIEDSTEFRANNQFSMDEQDSDIVNRIDFLMNELNRIMDGVEHPIRHNEFNSQASINFSKISEPK